MFIDVHCHLDYYSEGEIEKIIERAKRANVNIIITNGTNKKSNRKSLELAEKYKEVKSSLGLYPIEALSLTEKEIDEELKFIKQNKDKIAAIGEVGLDFKETEEKEKQIKVFKKIILLAQKIDRPLIIHSRKAEKEVIEILEEARAKKVIMHCFSGKKSLIERIKQNNWSMSIPANVKFSEHFQNAVKILPIENLLCETDSPFLHPFKEPNNEPANVIESYKKIAEIKSLPLKTVESIIENNYKKLFNS